MINCIQVDLHDLFHMVIETLCQQQESGTTECDCILYQVLDIPVGDEQYSIKQWRSIYLNVCLNA
jgi:hypothetical protein